MAPAFPVGRNTADQPLMDSTPYGSGPDDSITDTTEAAAVTHHMATIGGAASRRASRALIHNQAITPPTANPARKTIQVAT